MCAMNLSHCLTVPTMHCSSIYSPSFYPSDYFIGPSPCVMWRMRPLCSKYPHPRETTANSMGCVCVWFNSRPMPAHAPDFLFLAFLCMFRFKRTVTSSKSKSKGAFVLGKQNHSYNEQKRLRLDLDQTESPLNAPPPERPYLRSFLPHM